MKRQDSLRSSSSMRETTANSSYHTPLSHAPDSSIGCMAGVFHLISSNYRTRRKFLTFGKKQTTSCSSPQQPQQPAAPKLPARKGRGKDRDRLIAVHNNADNVRDEDSRDFSSLSCQIPRSPTIPPEIRRSNSLKSREIFRSPAPSSVVARLMGLEEAPPPADSRTPELAAEKRRKLLGALEKCDDDLQALKRIIEAARSTDPLETKKKCTDQMSSIVEQEQPSPVSVLEDLTESPPPSTTKRTENGGVMRHQQRKRPGEDKTETASNRSYLSRLLLHPRQNPICARSPPPPSSTMVEAVNEACRDVEMGQRMEIERVAVLLDDFVYRDLIDEFMKELMGCCHVYSYLPFDKCKRKLRF